MTFLMMTFPEAFAYNVLRVHSISPPWHIVTVRFVISEPFFLMVRDETQRGNVRKAKCEVQENCRTPSKGDKTSKKEWTCVEYKNKRKMNGCG